MLCSSRAVGETIVPAPRRRGNPADGPQHGAAASSASASRPTAGSRSCARSCCRRPPPATRRRHHGEHRCLNSLSISPRACSCEGRVLWAATPSGGRICLDADPAGKSGTWTPIAGRPGCSCWRPTACPRPAAAMRCTAACGWRVRVKGGWCRAAGRRQLATHHPPPATHHHGSPTVKRFLRERLYDLVVLGCCAACWRRPGAILSRVLR